MPRVPAPSDDVIAAMVKELRAELGMALFGVDVIMNIDTHTLTIIDINIFPSEATHKSFKIDHFVVLVLFKNIYMIYDKLIYDKLLQLYRMELIIVELEM